MSALSRGHKEKMQEDERHRNKANRQPEDERARVEALKILDNRAQPNNELLRGPPYSENGFSSWICNKRA